MKLMSRVPLSRQQLQDARGYYAGALEEIGHQGLEATASAVPSPDVKDVFAKLAALGMNPLNGQISLHPGDLGQLTLPPGLRVLVAYRQGRERRFAPGIILRNPGNVGVLTAQASPTDFGALTQVLLSNVFETQRSDVVSHDTQSARLVGGHALVAASYVQGGGNAHGLVHELAEGGGNFGARFDGTGARDIAVGHDRLRIRSAAFPVGSMALVIHGAYQPQEAGEGLLVAGISSTELNVATTIAATMSRSPGRDARVFLADNLRAMQGN